MLTLKRILVQRKARLALVMSLAAYGGGCVGYEEMDFRYNSQPPANVSLTDEQISIFEGMAVGAEAVPLCGGEPLDEETQVELEPDDPFTLRIQSAPETFDDEGENWNFVFVGVTPGSTRVNVIIDGEVEAAIDAQVLPQ